VKGQFGSRIPGERSIYLHMCREMLYAVLDTLSEFEAGVISMRFGLTDGRPKTRDEIGNVYSITREDVRRIESITISKLRHKSRSSVLRDYFDDQPFPWDRELGGPAERGLTYCERHGWCDQLSSPTTCECCPCPVWNDGSIGRPAKYCSKACKQAAYRARRTQVEQIS